MGVKPTDEELKNDASLKYRINTLYAVKGEISGCFEMYMSPYIDAEETELRNGTLSDL